MRRVQEFAEPLKVSAALAEHTIAAPERILRTHLGRRPRVLVLLGCHWPGNEASGPNESFRNWCDAFRDEIDFSALAHAGPPGNGLRIRTAAWTKLGFAQCRNTSRSMLALCERWKILRETRFDLIALNGLFDPVLTLHALVLRKAGLLPHCPVILSPRGELSPGALALKAKKKRAYLAFLKQSGLLQNVWLIAASELERSHIRAAFPRHERVLTAPNLRRPPPHSPLRKRSPGPLRLVYLGRIDAKKNLLYALDVVKRAGVAATFDLYGPVSDERYWNACLAAMRDLPAELAIAWRGVAPRDRVAEVLSGYDAFIFPTLGENFGHAIFDALEAGVPSIISDLTPLRDLASKSAGWDLPLSRRDAFVDAIRTLADSSAERLLEMRLAARAYAETYARHADAESRTRAMFEQVLDASP